MSRLSDTAVPSAVHAGQDPAAKRLVLLSGVFLVLQVLTTDYGAGQQEVGPRVGWVLVGTFLLWLVHAKRSRVARGVVVVTTLAGAVIYAVGAFEYARSALLVVLYLGQALPLLAAAVRRHVQAGHRRGHDVDPPGVLRGLSL